MNLTPEEPDDFDWGVEAEVNCPPMKPLTREEVAFFFEEHYPDGSPIPIPRDEVN